MAAHYIWSETYVFLDNWRVELVNGNTKNDGVPRLDNIGQVWYYSAAAVLMMDSRQCGVYIEFGHSLQY